jgi:cellulose synthase/poly-beta-1,6-N-acetylglucosamine synthase-like glycosyltransferase
MIRMLLLELFAVSMLLFAAIPGVLFLVNLRRYREPIAAGAEVSRVAVLVPARDEENNIGACLGSLLSSRGVALEVLVLDDGSTDRTAEIVRGITLRDPRVRLFVSQDLPAGWNGKQHACWLLAQASAAPLLLFLDADVRLEPDTIVRLSAQMRESRVALLSGFPRQVTVSFLEVLLLPLIHFVLLGFLPMGAMRRNTRPAYAAGCGQIFLAERAAYFASGGHAAIRATRHDGLRLPQAFRVAGHRTDIVDLTRLAHVRMYDSAAAVFMGLAKNATEGLAAPARIGPLTVILLLGQVFPTLCAVLWFAMYVSMMVTGATFDEPRAAGLVTVCVALALVANFLPRLIAARRFQQPVRSALLHPFGIVLLLVIQWYALGKQVLRSPIAWRDRT